MYRLTSGPGRYLCDYSYHNAQSDHFCTYLDARVLDEPITDLMLRSCGFTEHAEAVLAQIKAEYHTAREEARRHWPADYWLIETGRSDQPGINGGLLPRRSPTPQGKCQPSMPSSVRWRFHLWTWR
jgi:hypothetical protein